MASQRNRIIDLQNYLKSLNIDINIGKTKAHGNKGIFLHRMNKYRIDISKNLEEEEILSVLLHEFAHYVHYTYDSSLKSLDFIFENYNEEVHEELIKVTVQNVPKKFATMLYSKKENLSKEIKNLVSILKLKYPDFKLSHNNKFIESELSNPLKYLLKYDRVKIFNKIYSIDKLDEDFSLNDVQKNYIILKSKQRSLRRINSKINKLNRYYNNPSEMFARFVEMFYTQPEKLKSIAPVAYSKMEKTLIPEFKQINNIINQ